MQYDYYIASRWRNLDTVLSLTHSIRSAGKSVYSFLEAPHNIHALDYDIEQAMEEYEAIDDWWHDVRIRRMFDDDIRGIEQSHALILLLPAGKSAHIEAGIAFGMGKECILVGEQRETENLYLIFGRAYPSIDHFMQTLA